MLAALVLLTLGATPAVAPEAQPAPGCLPAGDGFLAMRLRGNIEEDVRWSGPALACTGMSRPDGRGLRLRFAAGHRGSELAVVFAVPELGIGASGRGVPVNVTLLDGAGERIYGTQGDSRCVLDDVEQQLLEGPGLPPRSYRVAARGFCVAPARAVDGEGSVLLTRFDFAGLVSWSEERPPGSAAAAADPFPSLPQADVEVATQSGNHRFRVWIAADDNSRARGLMFVRELPADRGMLFLFRTPQSAAFWMKDTYLPLDLIFIDPTGRVLNIGRDARPFSLAAIRSDGPVIAVLEVRAGTAARIGIAPGDRIKLPTLRTTFSTPEPSTGLLGAGSAR
jgi:hypothetical protein